MRFWLLLFFFISTATIAQKEGVEVQKSRLPLLPASTVERSAGQQYGRPPQFLSTHPSHESRIREIEANLQKVLPLYRKTNS
jgi:Zn-dependent protease with chaperone function